MAGTRVTLRFHPNNKSAVVDEIMDSYALEANMKIEFPTPGTATIVLPSQFVAEELAEEAVASPMCGDATITYNL